MRPFLLLDMNMSPEWVPFLQQEGYLATHWSSVGDARATDATISNRAVTEGWVILTRDVDFGTALALAHLPGPSGVCIRARYTLPDAIGSQLLLLLRHHETSLIDGVLIVLDESNTRVRILPL